MEHLNGFFWHTTTLKRNNDDNTVYKNVFFKITFPLKLFCKPSSPKNFSRFAWIHHGHLEDSEAL